MIDKFNKSFEKKEFIKKLPEGYKIIEDEELLDEVTGLVEFPTCYIGRFDEKFLELPREVLISVMKNHQKCFSVEDEKGNIAPYFIFVSNICPSF